MMYPRDSIECDVAIIGASLAGQAAALFAADRGLRVVQIGRPGVLTLASGLLDLLTFPRGEDRGLDPWASLAALVEAEPDHPYALVRPATVEAAFDSFIKALKSGGLVYRRKPGTNVALATALGTVKTTHGVPEAMWPGVQALADRRPTLVVGFEGWLDFSGSQIVAALAPSWPGLRATKVPWPEPGRVGGIGLGEITACCFERPDFLERLARDIRPAIGPAEYVGLPAVLGLDRHQSVVARLSELLDRPVFEIPTMPPSTPGLRLIEALRRVHLKQGVAMIWDKDVKSAAPDQEGFGLTVGHDQGAAEVHCSAVILATGRFLGRGLRADRHQVWESIFDLPVSQPTDRSSWHGRGFFDEHPINRAGLRVDPVFRPLARTGAPFHHSLFAVGSILAGQDWIRQGCGAGLSLATAYAAVRALVR